MQPLRFLVFTAHSLPLVSAAGVLVHNEILRRAIYSYSLPCGDEVDDARQQLPLASWLTQHAAYAQAGAFFPDWGYGCLGNDDASESAHWPPFLGAAIEHTLEKYPDIRSSTSGQQLLSFIFAVASHQNSDATWHSVKMQSGLLKAMAYLDFDQNYEMAHSVLDVGGDLMLAHEFALVRGQDGFGHLKSTWSVPIQDISEIYDRMGIRVNAFKIRSCMTRGFAALLALRRAGSALAPKYQAQSPFMSSHIEQHYLGSIKESSTTTVLCWTAMANWINTGSVPSANETWNVCGPMQIISRRGKAGPYEGYSRQQQLQSFMLESPDRLDYTTEPHDITKTIMFDYEGLVTSEMKTIATLYNNKLGLLTITSGSKYGPNAEISTKQVSSEAKNVPSFLTPSVAYAEFGTSLALVESQGGYNLAVGSPKDSDSVLEPAKGSTYYIPLVRQDAPFAGDNHATHLKEVVLSSAKTSSISTYKIAWSCEHEAVIRQDLDQNPYFGTSVVNIQLSGIDSLAILSQSKVEIFRSKNNTLEITPYITIRHQSQSCDFSKPPLAAYLYSFVLSGQSVLAVASPWGDVHARGIVHLFLADNLQAGFVDLESADQIIRSEGEASTPFDRLGSSLAYSHKQRILFVGLAGTRQVVAYKLQGQLRKHVEVFRVEDPSKQSLTSGFGSSGLLATGSHLYVGSSLENDDDIVQAGRVRIYHISLLYTKNSKRRNIPSTIKLAREIFPDQSQSFAQFGAKIIGTRSANAVYITSPNYDNKGALFKVPSLRTARRKDGHKIGLLAHLLKQTERSRTKPPKPKYRINLAPCLIGFEPSSRFSADVVATDDGLVIVAAPNEQGLSALDRRAGKVYLYENLTCSS